MRLYEYGKSIRHLEKTFNQCTKVVLENTLQYLNVEDQSKYVKPTIINNLICRVQNLLPDCCSICNESYSIRNGDHPFLECVVCGQEVHKPCIVNILGEDTDAANIQQLYHPFNLPGIHYICHPCEVSTLPHKDTGLKKKGKKLKSDETQYNNNLPDIRIVNQSQTISGATDRVIEEISDTDSINDNDNEVNANVEIDPVNKNSKIKICRFYLKGNCKHGIKGSDCSFNHPKAFCKLLQHGTRASKGCNKGNKCELYHPKMCMSSVREGICYHKECKFIHVKGTKRKKEDRTSQQIKYKKDHTGTNSEVNKKQYNQPHKT